MAGLLPERTAEGLFTEKPWRTWKIDWAAKGLDGFTDGTEALEQAMLLALKTPRFAHVIYSFSYGSELEGLVGRDRNYALAAAPGLAEECLQADDRIEQAQGVGFAVEGDRLTGTLKVKTRQGETVLQI